MIAVWNEDNVVQNCDCLSLERFGSIRRLQKF